MAHIADEMERPLVSVVCINKNNSSTLEQAIRSVLAQTVERMEFVIADGGSTDGSLEIIARYPQIRLLDGVDASRADGVLRAVRAARGKYIAFMTSTDGYVSQTWLKTATDYLENDHEASLVWGAAISMDAHGSLVSRFYPKEFVRKKKMAQKKRWFQLWMAESGTRLSYLPELSYCVKAEVYRRLIEPDPACPELASIDPILRFHFEFIRQGYLPVYLPALVYFGRTHPGQAQFSKLMDDWLARYNGARRAHVAQVLLGRRTHVWRDREGREIARMGQAEAIGRYVWTFVFESRLARSLRKHLGL
ncbi:MAG: glycosyltransferase [Hyphomicrobiales bacterium]|nr:glycosyltransferase [Hyphomicrobiales bacterium]